MAEKDPKDAKDPNDAKDTQRKYEGPRYEVRTPNPGFTRVHVCGLRFVDGLASTDNPDHADKCAENGYQVTDRATGKVRNPRPE